MACVRPDWCRLTGHLLPSLGLAVLILTTSGNATAAARAGTVKHFIGNATAASPEGEVRSLSRGSAIYSEEVLSTGPNSYLRVKYSDGAFMMLRPNTRFLIEKYVHTEKAEENRGFFSLLKGGLRTVSGLIGKLRKRNFRLTTPVATIGIRGTDFDTRVCAGDCLDVDPPPADGLYVGLNHNEGIVVINAGGTLEIRTAGTYGYTASPDQPAVEVAPKFASPLTQNPIPSADPQMCPE